MGCKFWDIHIKRATGYKRLVLVAIENLLRLPKVWELESKRFIKCISSEVSSLLVGVILILHNLPEIAN